MSAPRSGALRALAEGVVTRHPDDAARLFELAETEESVTLLSGVDPEPAAAVVSRLTPDRAALLLPALDGVMRGALLSALDPNRAAAIVARLETDEREACLASTDGALASELRALMTYPPDTAGSLMDPRVTTFRSDATVEHVGQRVRAARVRVQDIFVVDPDGRLVGSVRLQEAAFAAPGTRLDELLCAPVPAVRATSSQAEVVSELERHRVSSLPVLDFDGRVLGVLRQEQLVAAAQGEAATDAVMMVGAGREERALSSPALAVRKRLPWLQVNLLTAFLAAAVVGLFEDTIATFTALAVLLPVVAGQSGNTGAQALAVTMRGLALREVRTRHWWRVAAKEVAAGLGNGAAIALTTAFAVWLWSGSPGLALVIGTSMVVSMVLAGLSGATIPMILTALRQDPAQSSSIILTTVTDVAGFMSFLGIATLLRAAL